MWKILLDMPAYVQLSLMVISFFIGIGHVVIPFFILMNLGYAFYLFVTPYKPTEGFKDNN